MKLNGWQRTWVVLSIVWLAGIGSLFALSQRSEEERYHEWSNDLVQYLIEQSPELRGYTLSSMRATYSDLSDRQLVEALHAKYLPEHPAYRYGFSEIEAKYREGSAFGIVQAPIWLAVATGVPLAVYLFGFAVSWVRAGFQHA